MDSILICLRGQCVIRDIETLSDSKDSRPDLDSAFIRVIITYNAHVGFAEFDDTYLLKFFNCLNYSCPGFSWRLDLDDEVVADEKMSVHSLLRHEIALCWWTVDMSASR